MSVDAQFAPIVSAMTEKVSADVQELHEMASAYKARNGSPEAVQEFLNNSDDAEIQKELEYIAKAEEKIKQRKAALQERAKAALQPEGFDAEALAKEFKEKRTAARTLLLQSIGVLESIGQEDAAAELKDMQRDLPNLSGGVSASGKSPEEMEAIRSWARENGFEVKDRGRIAKEILDAYDARENA